MDTGIEMDSDGSAGLRMVRLGHPGENACNSVLASNLNI
jgi:hypothetical protein